MVKMTLLSDIDRLDQRFSRSIFNLQLGFKFDILYTFPGIAFGVPVAHGIFLTWVIAATQWVNGGNDEYFWQLSLPLTGILLLFWAIVIGSTLKLKSRSDIVASIRKHDGIFKLYDPRAMATAAVLFVLNVVLSPLLCDTVQGKTAALRYDSWVRCIDDLPCPCCCGLSRDWWK